ncbi:MAG: nuclear transport factor 2 family protein [Pseudomonadota bacterium]
MTPEPIRLWHAFLESREPAALQALLAEDVVFESPVVHTPQAGRAITTKYLTGAVAVLNGEAFRYLDQWFAERSAVLEFATEIDGIVINGVDIIRWDESGRIVRFKVMIRPLKAINLLHQRMGAMLAQLAG